MKDVISFQISPENTEWFKRLSEEAWLLAATEWETNGRTGTSQHQNQPTRGSRESQNAADECRNRFVV